MTDEVNEVVLYLLVANGSICSTGISELLLIWLVRIFQQIYVFFIITSVIYHNKPSSCHRIWHPRCIPKVTVTTGQERRNFRYRYACGKYINPVKQEPYHKVDNNFYSSQLSKWPIMSLLAWNTKYHPAEVLVVPPRHYPEVAYTQPPPPHHPLPIYGYPRHETVVYAQPAHGGGHYGGHYGGNYYYGGGHGGGGGGHHWCMRHTWCNGVGLSAHMSTLSLFDNDLINYMI